MRINTKKKKRISEYVNTTWRLQKHNNTLSYCDLKNVSIEYLFRHCYFSHHAKSTPLFRIKVIAEAEAVENSSEIARDYGPSESMARRWRRDQATILSGKLKMSAKRAKMGRFAPKCSELDEQAMEWFSQQRDLTFHL